MKKLLMLLVCVLTLGMTFGCANNNTEEPIENITKIEVSADVNVSGYELLGEYSCDIIGGVNEDDIKLYTSAKRDKKGELMWDDSQGWVIICETDNGVYELYNERIHGNAYMMVSDFYNDGQEEKVITLLVESNTAYEIREYRYKDGVFVEGNCRGFITLSGRSGFGRIQCG